jgi:hypothetical protein
MGVLLQAKSDAQIERESSFSHFPQDLREQSAGFIERSAERICRRSLIWVSVFVELDRLEVDHWSPSFSVNAIPVVSSFLSCFTSARERRLQLRRHRRQDSELVPTDFSACWVEQPVDDLGARNHNELQPELVQDFICPFLLFVLADLGRRRENQDLYIGVVLFRFTCVTLDFFDCGCDRAG